MRAVVFRILQKMLDDTAASLRYKRLIYPRARVRVSFSPILLCSPRSSIILPRVKNCFHLFPRFHCRGELPWASLSNCRRSRATWKPYLYFSPRFPEMFIFSPIFIRPRFFRALSPFLSASRAAHISPVLPTTRRSRAGAILLGHREPGLSQIYTVRQRRGARRRVLPSCRPFQLPTGRLVWGQRHSPLSFSFSHICDWDLPLPSFSSRYPLPSLPLSISLPLSTPPAVPGRRRAPCRSFSFSLVLFICLHSLVRGTRTRFGRANFETSTLPSPRLANTRPLRTLSSRNSDVKKLAIQQTKDRF